MNERILRLIVEAISNESVKKIFDNMLEKQTQSIVEQLSMSSKEEHTIAEIEKCRYLLVEEQKRRGELESRMKELVFEKEKLTTDYEEQIKRLIGECENKTVALQSAESNICRLQREIYLMSETCTKVQENYKVTIEAYEAFLELGKQTKDRLRNIFVADTFESFISACFEWDNIEGIWNYIKRGIIEKFDFEIDNLTKIFYYMFYGYNARFFKPKYVLISPAVGTRYNSEEQVILGEKTDGILVRVCIEGYKNCDGKIVNKALVEV